MIIRSLLLFAVVLLTTVRTPATTIGEEFIELDRPVITFSKEYPEVARRAVQAVLEKKDYAFLGGVKLNDLTSLRYQGGTATLNRFLADLADCLGVLIQVSFSHELDAATDWRVFHEPHANKFRIEVAYQSPRIDLGKLVLPLIGKQAAGLH